MPSKAAMKIADTYTDVFHGEQQVELCACDIDAAIRAATEEVWIQHREQLATRDKVWADKVRAACERQREACANEMVFPAQRKLCMETPLVCDTEPTV